MSGSTYPDRSRYLPNGVTVKLVRADGNDVLHGWALEEKLFSVIESEARTHDAVVERGNFNGVLDAVRANKLQAYFIVVGWDNCRPKFAGGAIEFPTVLTEWNGREFKHYPAMHGEDTYVPKDISAEFRDRTITSENPRGIGLGTYFMHERIGIAATNEYGNAPFGMASRGRIAEYSAHSTAMVKLLTKLGATLGTEEEGTILQLDALSSRFKKGRRASIQTAQLVTTPDLNSAIIQPNVFLTTWTSESRNQRIVASFTEAIATFTGEPIVRVQFTSNGNTPSGAELRDIVGAHISAGRSEILKRNWIPKGGVADLTNARMIMRIHALREPAIGVALREIGAEQRTLGPHPMLPVITNLANTPNGVLSFKIPNAKPLRVVKPHSEEPEIGRPTDRKFREQLALSYRPPLAARAG